ncbi:MAG TPA: NYN domain-containing protein, partial [Ktedonobacteraceae bacterium]
MTTQNTESENSDINETVVQQPTASETTITSAEAEVIMPANEQDTQTQEIQSKTSEKQIEEEPVRSFTDYIEEFRQKEVQFGSLLEEPQVEPFSALMPGEDPGRNEFTPGWTNTPLGDSLLLEATPIAAEDVESHSNTQIVLPVGENGNGAEEPAELHVQPAAEAEAALPAVRQTSPLLRPSSRVRLPRQAGMRHREESVVEEQTQQEQKSETTLVTTPSIGDTSKADATPVEEKPRPERRYRFDRRTPAASTTATTTQPRTEESKGNNTSSQGFQRTNNELPGEREEQVKQLSDVAQSTELISSTQELVQEQVVTQTAEAEKAKPTKTTHDIRRRHGQVRQRAKVQATPSASIPVTPEVIAPVAEIIEPQVPEVALEDLPPLEYAELQAANSRRRRRRRSGSSSQATVATNASANPVGAKPVTPEQTVTGAQILSTPSPASPPATVTRSTAVPESPVSSTGPYSIQSGHTVSQMNQGNGESGPFMGPEPSPARGSGSSIPRTVRPIRNEVQRMPAYPVRQEGAASSASINHLANVVAQAIQTQSDRMVAELRRANQIPTNVSVSLPPFPSTERVGVFVDVANLLYSARTQRLTIDFGRLLDFLRGNRRLVRAHAYCPTSPQPGDDQMFLQAVKGLGYRITTKNYKTFSSGAKKADL